MKLGRPAILVCPFCGHDSFIRKSEEEVNMVDDGDSITDELKGNGWSEFYYFCTKCKKEVTHIELKRQTEKLDKVC